MMHATATTRSVSEQALESGLDRLALEIAAFGERGHILLPLYAALEEELSQMREGRQVMNAVLARLQRVEDRRPKRS